MDIHVDTILSGSMVAGNFPYIIFHLTLIQPVACTCEVMTIWHYVSE